VFVNLLKLELQEYKENNLARKGKGFGSEAVTESLVQSGKTLYLCLFSTACLLFYYLAYFKH